jgi:hypothetical protein
MNPVEKCKVKRVAPNRMSRQIQKPPSYPTPYNGQKNDKLLKEHLRRQVEELDEENIDTEKCSSEGLAHHSIQDERTYSLHQRKPRE